MRKLTTLLLAMTMLCSCVLPAFAAEITTNGDSANTTVQYGASESYIVTVPDSAVIGDDGLGNITVSISNALLASQSTLNVYISSDSFTNGYWNLTNTTQPNEKLKYSIKKNSTNIANNDIVLSVAAGEAWDSTVSATLALQLQDTVTQAGLYQDTLTFTVERLNNSTQTYYGTYQLAPNFMESVPVADTEDIALLSSVDLENPTEEERGMLAEHFYKKYGIAFAAIKMPWVETGSHLEHAQIVDCMEINGMAPLIYVEAMDAYILTLSVSAGNENIYDIMLLPASMVESMMDAMLANAPFVLTEECPEEYLDTLLIKISDDALIYFSSEVCAHYNDNEYQHESFGTFVGMTWREYIAQFGDGQTIEGSRVIFDIDDNGNPMYLSLNGRYVHPDEEMQCAMYEAAPMDESIAISGNVYEVNDNATPIIVPEAPLNEEGYSEKQELLESLYNEYKLTNFVSNPNNNSLGNTILGVTAMLKSNAEGATPIYVLKMNDADGVYYTVVALDTFATKDIMRYLLIDDTVSATGVAADWLQANATKVKDSSYTFTVIGALDGYLPEVAREITIVTAYDGLTWGELVADMQYYGVSTEGYIYQEAIINGEPVQLFMHYDGSDKLITADDVVLPMASAKMFVHHMYRRISDGTMFYACQNCGEYQSVIYNQCDNADCQVDGPHGDCCCGTKTVESLTFKETYNNDVGYRRIYFTDGMTWGEWLESKYATKDATVRDGYICNGAEYLYDETTETYVQATDLIVANHSFDLKKTAPNT